MVFIEFDLSQNMTSFKNIKMLIIYDKRVTKM